MSATPPPATPQKLDLGRGWSDRLLRTSPTALVHNPGAPAVRAGPGAGAAGGSRSPRAGGAFPGHRADADPPRGAAPGRRLCARRRRPPPPPPPHPPPLPPPPRPPPPPPPPPPVPPRTPL